MEPGKHDCAGLALELPGCRGLDEAGEGTMQAQSGLCAQTLADWEGQEGLVASKGMYGVKKREAQGPSMNES